MLSSAPRDSKSVPLLPALAAMTALQMLTSCALMAPAVMAPRIGIDAATLGLYATAGCVVGMLTTFIGGVYAGRYGSFRVATVCATFVLCATAVSALAGATSLLIAAGIILGAPMARRRRQARRCSGASRRRRRGRWSSPFARPATRAA